MIYITRKEHFNAAHKLYNPDWTVEKNEEMFGSCANANWHGHNFELIVTVRGKPSTDTGFVVDLKKLGEMINKEIIEKVDHLNMDLDVSFLKGQMNSCENIVIKFWEILAPKVILMSPDAQLHKLQLIETPKNYVEYFGEVK
jgi:6-pyruvoyltetrahydropterin/6-carboxytetrahydropterin synthase